LSRPFSSRSNNQGPYIRVNGKIRAREVRVIGPDGQQLGILPLGDALTIARNQGVDLVEVAPNANPPVCKVIDFGKYRYELAKKEKESKKHQHGNKVKEIQLSPKIDPHDFATKLQHAIDFLCDDMKVKVTLRFRGRELAHKEIGFDQVNHFIRELAPYAHPDAPPKLIGKGINVMLSPLPKNKRAKNPRAQDEENEPESSPDEQNNDKGKNNKRVVPVNASENPSSGFTNNPFSKLESQEG